MSTKHTPGPWKLMPRSQDKIDVIHENGAIIGHSSLVLARVTARQGWLAEQTANARLIAAAPELLEALNNILVGMEATGGWDGDDELFNAGVAAYKKAIGDAK